MVIKWPKRNHKSVAGIAITYLFSSSNSMSWSHIKVFATLEKVHEIFNLWVYTLNHFFYWQCPVPSIYTWYWIASRIPFPGSLDQLGSSVVPHLVGIGVFHLTSMRICLSHWVLNILMIKNFILFSLKFPVLGPSDI